MNFLSVLDQSFFLNHLCPSKIFMPCFLQKTVFITLTAKDFLLGSPLTQRPTLLLPQYLTNLEQKALSGFCPELSEVKSLSRVRLFATPWTAAYQAPPSMGFPGKSTGVGCHSLLQGIFLSQGLNPGLQHYRQMLYPLSH